jgi:hypothetical protein
MSDNTDKAQQKASPLAANSHDQSVTAEFAPVVAWGDKNEVISPMVASLDGRF